MAVSAIEVRKKVQQNARCVEDVLVNHFIEAMNSCIGEEVSHGRHMFFSTIPTARVGFPCFDSLYVAERVREAYRKAGFGVSGQGLDVHITWSGLYGVHEN
jgi:hypothetical protein